MNTGHHKATDGKVSCDELTREFCLWMLSSLELRAEHEGDGIYCVEVPEDRRSEFGDVDQFRFVCSSGSTTPREKHPSAEVQCMAPGAPLFHQLLDQLRRPRQAIHAVPRQQPAKVHELTPRLLGAYRFDGGQIHLGGCTLEDRPMIRLTYMDEEPRDHTACLRHVYTWPDGHALDVETIGLLGLERLTLPGGRIPRIRDEEIASWLQRSDRDRPQRVAATDQLLLQCVIWCKFAEGKVVFASHDRTVEIPFAGWAQGLANGRQKPPPFRCVKCGKQSYHLAVTDDGQISVAEGIAICEESGNRVIESELERCAVSGRRVLGKFMQTCPLTGERVTRGSMVPCGTCRQRVSPSAMKGDRCTACRRLQAVAKDDPRLARVLGEYPGLDRWSRWRLSETSRVYVLLGGAWWRQLLVVVDKHTLDALHLAAAGRFLSGWREISYEQMDKYLR